MTQCTKFSVDRNDFRNTKITTTTLPPLQSNEILVAIDRFAITANNVTYAVTGDMIGYWHYFPSAEDGWGNVTVWGYADVIESNCADIALGERLFGFFPMASHTTLQPGKISQDQLIDSSTHRADLPALYNHYRRTHAEPKFLQQIENERCLLFPLFATSYLLYDYLLDNHFFSAQQVLIGSASSKTGFGLAQLLQQDGNIEVIGLTSPENVDFIQQMSCYDKIITYGNEADIDAKKATAFIDMSGNTHLKTVLHHHLQNNMVESTMVGASHWEQRGNINVLAGAKPKFFFAPAQIAKRDQQWGKGVIWTKAMQACAEMVKSIDKHIKIEQINNTNRLTEVWLQLLDNKISPHHGLIASLL